MIPRNRPARRRRHPRATALIALTLAGALVACGKPAPAGPAGELTLYSAQHQQTTAALAAEFTKQTGIKVNVVNGDEDATTAKIEQEGACCHCRSRESGHPGRSSWFSPRRSRDCEGRATTSWTSFRASSTKAFLRCADTSRAST